MALVASFEQTACKPKFPVQPGVWISGRRPHTRVRHHHQGKGVGLFLQRRQVRLVVQQLGRAEAQHQLGAQQLIAELSRPPRWIAVRQDAKGGATSAEAVADAVVVDEHALREARGWLRLHLHMHQHPLLLAILELHLNQLVHHPPTQRGILSDLLELFVQEFVPGSPVDLGVGTGKEEGHEFLELQVEDVFPRRIVVLLVGHCTLLISRLTVIVHLLALFANRSA
ncbi:MAG: hypothetical protein IPF85_00305 [Anaerolineae bacterium]|nr:hypothetical protein [Anaerolineae bacterium]